MPRRRVTFVTGTRAEFGLMEHALRVLRADPRLELQLIATGMHLSRAHGYTVAGLRKQGWPTDATVPWRGATAQATGTAMAGLAAAYARLRSDVVLVVGDRVEAFAAASAAHLSGRVVAHVHGGDRALGQVDDALRHAISKLSHLHFAATAASGRRLRRLGEDAFRVHVIGTPGLDGLPERASGPREPSALVLLHPDGADEGRQARQARMLMTTLRRAGVDRGVIVWPNNDPGWRGIARVWSGVRGDWTVHQNLPRVEFLRRLGSCAFLIGNSSSGVIEAASLGARVINIGDRQLGRERSPNLIDVPWKPEALSAAIASVWNKGNPKAYRGRNAYGGGDAGMRMAGLLATAPLDERLRKKLICY
ncbi:MAG TPA: UDP-N-acetylglucosamine 2-epimerase [Tepidisphaeraceae bacterium]|jgi:UDP-hydrolysing UDP-N-acetyl-D-glucosamine 2-epimerase